MSHGLDVAIAIVRTVEREGGKHENLPHREARKVAAAIYERHRDSGYSVPDIAAVLEEEERRAYLPSTPA